MPLSPKVSHDIDALNRITISGILFCGNAPTSDTEDYKRVDMI